MENLLNCCKRRKMKRIEKVGHETEGEEYWKDIHRHNYTPLQLNWRGRTGQTVWFDDREWRETSMVSLQFPSQLQKQECIYFGHELNPCIKPLQQISCKTQEHAENTINDNKLNVLIKFVNTFWKSMDVVSKIQKTTTPYSTCLLLITSDYDRKKQLGTLAFTCMTPPAEQPPD